MPKCKMIVNRKKYLFINYVGTSNNFFGRIWVRIKSVYWSWRLDRMSEGEIINRYYSLTDRKDETSLCLKDI